MLRLSVFILFCCWPAFADDYKMLSPKDMKDLAQNLSIGVVECPQLKGVKELWAGEFANKTDESLDKNQFLAALKSELQQKGITLKLESAPPDALRANLSLGSTKTETKQTYIAVYKVQSDLISATKSVCAREGTLRKKHDK